MFMLVGEGSVWEMAYLSSNTLHSYFWHASYLKITFDFSYIPFQLHLDR